jgi:methyl-accepting chemotaxis protein
MGYKSKFTGSQIDALLEKIDDIDIHEKVSIDSEFSLESENPVQNKVVTSAINGQKESVKVLSQSVEQLGEKVDEYDDAISDAIAKSNSAAESVQTITSEIEKISEHVGTLSDKVDNLENGEISWTEVQ